MISAMVHVRIDFMIICMIQSMVCFFCCLDLLMVVLCHVFLFRKCARGNSDS